MYSDEINKLSKKIITIGAKNKVLISTAESCTGGMIGSVITSVPGSSSVYDRGFVTYSNESKAELLDIDINLINKYGAVSKEIAVLMAEGCLKKSYSNLTVSVTGVAGPGGGTYDKPVGLVHMAIARENSETIDFKFLFANKSRDEIRELTTLNALKKLFDNF